MKRDLAEWVDWNWEKLLQHHLICTGTTGKMVAHTLMERRGNQQAHFDITFLKSGPLGGDQQLGAMIAEGGVEALIFFWDPMQAQPHDVDVKALLRLATLYNVPTLSLIHICGVSTFMRIIISFVTTATTTAIGE